MMAAREEEVPERPAAAIQGADGGSDGGDDGSAPGPSQGGGKRGRKRTRREAAPSTPSSLGDEAITTARLKTFTTLVARVFGRQQKAQLPRAELLEGINSMLA